MLGSCTHSNDVDNVSRAVAVCYTLSLVFNIHFFHLKLRKIL